MPFDVATESPAIRRTRLAMELRCRNFPHWDFADGCRCAVPVAMELYGYNHDILLTALGITRHQYSYIFGIWVPTFHYSFYYGCRASRVTPTMVADALERINN